MLELLPCYCKKCNEIRTCFAHSLVCKYYECGSNNGGNQDAKHEVMHDHDGSYDDQYKVMVGLIFDFDSDGSKSDLWWL